MEQGQLGSPSDSPLKLRTEGIEVSNMQQGHVKYTAQRKIVYLLTAAISICLILSKYLRDSASTEWNDGNDSLKGAVLSKLSYKCQQVDPLAPSKHSNVSRYLESTLANDDYLLTSRGYLSGIIRIPSESFDDFDEVGKDPRWNKFFKIEEYLEKTFPVVFDTLELTHINTHGLVLTWTGSEPAAAAKPILLTAHQDVVPVLEETLSQWIHGPFSGHDDGNKIWGRGSSDDKGYLISLMESVDLLIKGGLKPARTIIIAFGFDEETSGSQGAGRISQYLLETYGPDSIYLLIDEGAPLFRRFGRSIAMPAVGEKGYVDIRITVTDAGGHASLPPDHTSIGILSDIIVHLEANAFTPKLTAKSPMFNCFQCLSIHGRGFPKEISRILPDIAAGDKESELAVGAILSQQGKQVKYLLATSQAVDKISGGLKINALPEQVSTEINIRIAVDSSVEEIKQHYTNRTRHFAEKYHLEYCPFIEDASNSTSKSKLVLEVIGDTLEPAPVSPLDNEQYRILSGTIRSTLSARLNDEIIVAPGLISGNTDTKFYWALTDNIYRFNPYLFGDDLNNIHTVNEFTLVEDRPYAVKFFADLILNADEAVGTMKD